MKNIESLWRTITAGGEWSGEFLNKAKDGSLFWERALITSIKDEAGRITHFLSVKEDITERKKAEEAMQQMHLQLTHVARLSTLGEMVAELAHELNHPLYAILNYAKACAKRARRRRSARSGQPARMERGNRRDRLVGRRSGQTLALVCAACRVAAHRLPHRGDH